MRRKSVYVTCPNGSWKIHKHVVFVLLNLQVDPRYKVRIALPTNTPYVDNLHACMNDFLDIGKEDYWLSMDDDNPPLKNPLDLIEDEYDLVGFPTPVLHIDKNCPGDQPWYFNALRRHEDGYMPLGPDKWSGMQYVDAIGSGCFMVSRQVMLALRHQQPFMRSWDRETGRTIKGCDYSFCDKVKAAGFSIMAAMDYKCRHFNEVELLEIIEAFSLMFRKNQEIEQQEKQAQESEAARQKSSGSARRIQARRRGKKKRRK